MIAAVAQTRWVKPEGEINSASTDSEDIGGKDDSGLALNLSGPLYHFK